METQTGRMVKVTRTPSSFAGMVGTITQTDDPGIGVKWYLVVFPDHEQIGMDCWFQADEVQTVDGQPL